MAPSERPKFQGIFASCQFSVTSHERLLKHLKQLYDEMPQDAFLTEFIRCLQVALFHGEKVHTVENTLNFASKFIALLLQTKPANADQSLEEEEEEICPFVLNVLKFLFENHDREHQPIRFRVCQFINKVLNGLGNEACIDDTLCDQISESMMERLQDKAPAVRMQAILALHRLQDPTDQNCIVMKAYMFHMSMDPNADVRRAVIANIAITSQSVRCIRERIHDIKETVRRSAFVSLSKIGVQRFSISQRVQLITDGLKDSSALVRDSVSKILLPSWLQFYKGSFLALLHAFDCENSTEISSLALQALFKSEPIKTVLEELTKLLNEDKVIPVKDLSPDNVLYWRVLCEYLEAHPEIADERPIDEPLPELLPELSTFCNYIREFFEAQLVEELEDWVKLQNQFILTQLLELCLNFDLADEMGRVNLHNLCIYILTNSASSEVLVPVVVKVMVRVVPEVEDRLRALAEAISEVSEPMTDQETESATVTAPAAAVSLSVEELRQKELKQASIRVKINELQEEKDDAIRAEDFQRAQVLKEEFEKLQLELQALTEVVVCAPPPPPESQPEVRDTIKDEKALHKCLCIVREMVQAESVKNLTATLRSLMHNFILPCLQEDNSSFIRNMALECLGLFCMLDRALAQENFLMFCFQIANDEVCEIALKATFDLLLLYGLEAFHIQEDDSDPTSAKKSKKKKNLFVTDMFDDEFDTEEEESQETIPNVSSGSSGNASNLISMLTSLLDSASTSMRNIAMEGLYKLLHACRITSAALLSRLILMWFSPVTDGDETLRQPLGMFLTLYSSECPRSQETLEQAFLPTLNTLMQAPVISPLTQIDQDTVARLFVSLTRLGTNKFHSKMSHIHNNMALSICNAVMDCDDSTNIGVLLRTLSILELSLGDPIYRDELKTLIKRVKQIFMQSKEKSFQRYLDKISQQIESAAENVSMRTTEVDNTAASSQFETASTNGTIQEAQNLNKKAKLLHPRTHSVHTENGEDEAEDSDDSQKTRPLSCSLVIPPSPPGSSDSEEEDSNAKKSHPRSRGRPKSDKNSLDVDVFKKPKTKPARSRNGNRIESTSSSDVDAAPARKRRKAADKKNQQEDDRAEVPKGKTIASSSANAEENIREEISPKRHINPTEKGATLKTFQNISASMNLVASPTSTPPAKRMKKATQEERKKVATATSASPVRSSTRKSVSFQTKMGSPESPPISAAELRLQMSKKGVTASSKSKADANASPDLRKLTLKGQTKSDSKSASALSTSSGSDLDSAASTRSGRMKRADLPAQPARKPQQNTAASGTEKLPEKPSKAEPVRSTRRSASQSDSEGSQQDNAVLPSQPARKPQQYTKVSGIAKLPEKPAKAVPVRSTRKSASQSDSEGSQPVNEILPTQRAGKPQQYTKVSGTSKFPEKPAKAVPVRSTRKSASQSDSEGSQQDNAVLPSQHAVKPQHYSTVSGTSKFPEKPAKAVPVRSTRKSTSQSDTEGSPQISISDHSEEMSPSYPKTRRSITHNQRSVDLPVAQQKKNLQTQKAAVIDKIRSEEEQSTSEDSSPLRRSSRGNPEVKLQPAKKRPVEALKSTSSDCADSESSPGSSRGSRNRGNAEGKSTPTQPEKKTRTKTPSKDSPLLDSTRRSLRSQVETPSPRTRSGKI